ncbi:MAG: DUF3226 domain-containing protein [Myxococcota bacterium]
MSRKLLLVEGATDVGFFRRLVQDIPAIGDINIRPPRDFNYPNTVTVLPQLLPQLIAQLEAGQTTHFGVVADADHVSGGGIKARWNTLTHVLRGHGYRASQTPPSLPNQGSVFQHNDGLPPVGLWLMPNHHQNGMLEDLILSSVIQNPPQPALLSHAKRSIQAIPDDQTLFSPHQHAKALVYTWLAWQQRPGLGLGVALGAGLLDPQQEPYRGLRSWFERTFS